MYSIIFCPSLCTSSQVPSTPPASSPFHRVLVLANVLRKVFFERLASLCSEEAPQGRDRTVLQFTVSCEVLASCALWFLAAPPSFPALSSEERKTTVLFGSKLLKVSGCWQSCAIVKQRSWCVRIKGNLVVA